jgi:hypothetical protein
MEVRIRRILTTLLTILIVSESRKLDRRVQGDSGEHVILTSCQDQNGVKSSQMAYFKSNPGPSPDSVAIVQTGTGLTRVWEKGITSATFQDSDVFTANITAPVPQGEYAGTGQNNYGPFTCWDNYVPNLYKRNGDICTEIYDCNHSAAPSKLILLSDEKFLIC